MADASLAAGTFSDSDSNNQQPAAIVDDADEARNLRHVHRGSLEASITEVHEGRAGPWLWIGSFIASFSYRATVVLCVCSQADDSLGFAWMHSVAIAARHVSPISRQLRMASQMTQAAA